MQLIAACAIAALLTTSADACSLAVGTPGLLGLSMDGTQLASDNVGGVASVLSLSDLNLLTSTTITISAPTLQSYPAGFAAGAVVGESAFSATWLLSSTSRPYSTSDQSFTVPGVLNLVVAVTLNNRLTSSGGFKQGSYTSQTVVTCS